MVEIRWPWARRNTKREQRAGLALQGGQTDRAIRILTGIGILSLLAIVAAGFFTGGGARLILWAYIGALAAAVVGAALGLLFGLPTSGIAPRSRAVLQSSPSPAAAGGSSPTPESSQQAASDGAANATASADNGGDQQRESDIGYRDSTSLEQVADWLTKIIVGLTLTQYSSWEARFDIMARNLTETMIGPASVSAQCTAAIDTLQGPQRIAALASPLCQTPESSAIPGGVLLALAATIGFLIAYLWMRRYFILEMVVATKSAIDYINAKGASDVASVQNERALAEAQKGEQKAKADLERLRAEATAEREKLEQERATLQDKLNVAGNEGRAQFNAETDAASKSPSLADYKQTLKKGSELLPKESPAQAELTKLQQNLANPAPDPEDPWREKFGGQPVIGGMELKADVKPTASPNTFQIDLAVQAQTAELAAAVLGKKAIYFLHPTFGPDPRVSNFDTNGTAPLQLYAYGAFTVGVILEDGTQLELNLATLANAPATFRSR